MAANKIRQEHKANIIKSFAQHAQDTGSSAVTVALLTDRIVRLTQHAQKNPKDFSTKRGLLKLVCERRSHLEYLEKTNYQSYKEIIERLGLKK